MIYHQRTLYSSAISIPSTSVFCLLSLSLLSRKTLILPSSQKRQYVGASISTKDSDAYRR